MDEKPPSRTALGAAAYRAAHQAIENGSIFTDPLARLILGAAADAIISEVAVDPAKRPMRMFIAARSRFAEDRLSAAVSRGVRQAVILGAGIDTLSLRNPNASSGLRMFEVDHPATQAWKRERLGEVGLAVPTSMTFVPIDLDKQGLMMGLLAAGFRPDNPAFFHWLGVVPYLRLETIAETLRFIASV